MEKSDMKNLFQGLVFLLTLANLSVLPVSGSAQITFIRNYGYPSPYYDWGQYAQQTSDGGYILAGSTDGSGFGLYDEYLIKTDAYGEPQWNYTYGDAQKNFCNAVQQTTDGGYILGGSTQTGTSTSIGDIYDFSLIKTNATGNPEWFTTFGDANSDICNFTQQTTDGGYILTGSSKSTVYPYVKSVMVIKTDLSGNPAWIKYYYGSYDGYTTHYADSYFIQQTTDGGYILTGFKGWGNAGGWNEDIFLLKLDYNGDSLWSRSYDHAQGEHGYCVRQTIDGGFVIAGYSSQSCLLIKTDPAGDAVWTQFPHPTGELRSVQQLGDGQYIMAGKTGMYNATDVYLAKTDYQGNVLWSRTYFSAGGEDAANCVQQTTDGGYMVTGFTNTLAFYDIFLIKTNIEGTVGIREIPGAEMAATPQLLQNYPNPFQLQTTIRFSIPDKNFVSLRIFNASGREIGVLVSEELLPGVYESGWEPADLPDGIYWCRLQSGHFTAVKKLVLIR